MDQKQFLEYIALQLRIDSVRSTSAAGSGHPTSCLSAADIISALFFSVMHFDKTDPNNPGNDRFILSKGHAIPVVYAAYKHLGVITDEQLLELRKFDSPLEGHPTPRFPYNEAATGSLGQGLGVGVGFALASRLDGVKNTTYVMLGDGEIAEGSVWEAAEIAAKENLANLVAVVDCNRLGQSEPTLHQHHVDTIANKFAAFGWDTYAVDGHSIDEILAALEAAKENKSPTMIVAKTFKGYGLDDREDKNSFHGKPHKPAELDGAVAALSARFGDAANYSGETNYTPPLPTKTNAKPSPAPLVLDLASDPSKEKFALGEKLATRKAFGHALAALGRVSQEVVVLDGDVKNSTFTQTFQDEFPDRFIQCYIAEQNMVSTATGLTLRGKISFAATFACFLTRAFDQIRMAGIGRVPLRLSGSHCGVSIGEDGPSQMGLEDLGMMRSVPNSVVLYPSDAVSTYKLVGHMANYTEGMSYIRTTRSDTPVLYAHDEQFEIGGSKIVRQSESDSVVIVAAGITLHEALSAHKQLLAQGVNVAVLDCYSIKPLDVNTLRKLASKSKNRVIVVEDHYQAGGLGEAVTHALVNDNVHVEHLFVNNISRSGTPAQLLADAGIDAKSIIDNFNNFREDAHV